MTEPKNSVCYGIHAVTAVIEGGRQVSTLYLSAESSSARLDALSQLAKDRNIQVIRCKKERLDKLSGFGSHQGAVAECKAVSGSRNPTIQQVLQSIDSDHALILILDHLQDPHNLGACLRTAECAGVDAVILPKHSACPVNQTVIKVASGAVEFLKIVLVSNLVAALETLKKNGFWVYGASEHAEADLYQTDFCGRAVLVIGNEAQGVKRLVAEACDLLVRIPSQGEVQSLNASVATGVCLFEIRRQFGEAGLGGLETAEIQ